MASCSYIMKNKQGEELLGFREYRKNLGYTSAKEVFVRALSPDFQKDYSRYIKYDEQNVPTYESVMSIPYVKNLLGTQKLASAAQKNYIWVANTRDDYERLVNEAYTFNTSNPNNDSLTAIVEQSEDNKKIRVSIVGKSAENDKKAFDQYGVLTLNNRLSEIFSDLGVNVGLLEQYEAEHTNGVVDFSKADSMAEGFEKLIRIANNAEGVQALPEEFSHLIIGIFRDHPIVTRSLNILNNNTTLVREILGDEYQAVTDSYEGAENKEELVAEEALGRVLQEHLLQSNERKQTDDSFTLNKLVSRLVNWLKGVFRKYNINDVIEARQIINDSMQELSRDFLNGKKKITKQELANAKRNAAFNHLREDVDNVLQLVQNAIETERKRLKIIGTKDMERRNVTNQRIATLNGLVNDHDKLKGLITYAKWALSDLMEANTLLDNISTIEGATKFYQLRNIQTILQSYSEFIKDFRKTLDQYQDAQIIELNGEEIDLADLWRRVDEQFQSSTSRYERTILPAFISFISPFYDKSPLKDKEGHIIPLERIFKTADKNDIERRLILNEDVDITYFDKMAVSMGTSSSIIAQMFDKVVKTARDKVRLKTMDQVREIWNLREKAEKRGITSFEWMFEKNNKGKKTGYYISEYNYGQFEEDYQALLDSLKEKYGENPYGDDYVKYNAERKAWLSDHAQNLFGKPMPNDTYLNPEYDKLSKAQRDTLDEFLNYKRALEAGLPKNQVSALKAIQRRRSSTQRLLDSANNPGATFDNIKEEVSQILDFSKKDDDDQIYGSVSSGLTDFTGKEYMTLPLLYTNKIKNTDELSTDVFSDLMAYSYTTNTFKELDKIVDPLEIGKEAVKQKRLLKTRGSKVIEEEVYVDGKKTKRPVYVDEMNNNLLGKIQDFMECQMYGRYLKPQGEIFGKDTQKLTSFIMKLTSTAYLGCNYLAGIANVGTAIGMQNIEAFSREWFSPKDLASADKEYAAMLPEFIAELGSRNKQSKLALFDELFDVRQDYRQKVNKTQKKNYLQRIFGNNLLFLQQGAGDHWIYNRTAIAMAKHYKVNYKGSTISLWDALEVVVQPSTGKKIMRVREGVKNLDGTEFSVSNFGRNIAHINHTLVGTYNDEDQNAANRVAVGRLLQQMRKWIIPQMMRRFEGKRTVADTGKEEEGYYRTFGRFIWDLRKAQFNVVKEWDGLTFEEKANMRRATTELLQITALWLMLQFVNSGTKDPDRCWALKFAEYMLNREVHELGFLAPTPLMAQETIKTVQSPFVVASALGDIAHVAVVAMNPQNWIEEVENGKYEGYTRMEAAVLKSPLPPITWYKQINKMFDDLDAGTRFYSRDFR